MDLIQETYSLFHESNPEFPDYFSAPGAHDRPSIEVIQGSRLVAIGYPSQKDETTWGKNCWLKFFDYGCDSPESAKRLFTNLAADQYESGVRNFYVEVGAHQHDLIKSFFELGFGQQHVSAILRGELSPIPKYNYEIRPLEENDLLQAAELERELNFHQLRSPVFSSVQPESVEEITHSWSEEIQGDRFVTRVAVKDDQVVGFAYGCSTEKSSLHSGLLRPKLSATLAFCAIAPQMRRLGIARALATSIITELKDRGFEHIVTDWRATNQLSSNTWPSLGFVPTILRLHRAI